ncbi:CcdB family protein [Litoreibacter roseus]|uniref:Toxin CcdB n=1 Tax=Litoreibacter roseus TaxID=2601869 RepID=A0A6N6JLV0_9RHOB|nr:CcdB family protein [Litoreibacter roseus]GFE67286.1 plasmid maintenance protein CcdB [Litoreibacter roseus]
MAKYGVFLNPTGDGFLLDVQTDLLSDLNTRVVVPLLPQSRAPKPATRLNPTFIVNGEVVVMVTQFMAAVPAGILRSSVGKLDGEFENVTAAVDMLMQGF